MNVFMIGGGDIARHHGRAVLRLGGTVTGEHGVGISKALNFQQERKTEIECINDIKRAFDPKNILNPGKASQWRGSPLQHLRYPCKEYM